MTLSSQKSSPVDWALTLSQPRIPGIMGGGGVSIQTETTTVLSLFTSIDVKYD